MIMLWILFGLLWWTAYEITKAPRGYQDASGFHEGEEP